MATPSKKLTDAQRAQLGAALLHATATTRRETRVDTGAAPALTLTPRVAIGECYGDVLTTENYHTAGANLFSVSVGVANWCTGPGFGAIVEVDGWSFPSWAWGPYCINEGTKEHAADAAFPYDGSNSTVAHGLHTASGGVSYAFGCASLKSGEDALRIWYNGKSDNVDDWGY